MPGCDWIPLVSQIKSAFQILTLDFEGAAETAANFVQECPIISQLTSAVLLVSGDVDGAIETQKKCVGTINNVANGLPVIGHAKGLIHHVVGDHEGGNQALNAATRTTVVLGSGAAAALASGGLAAIPAGIAAGTAYDTFDSVINDKPKGVIGVVKNAVDNTTSGNIFDVAASFVGDGLTGYSGGQIGTKIATNVKLSKLEAARTAKNEQLNAGLFPEDVGGGGGSMTSAQVQSLGQQINALTSEINQIRQGTPQYWWDPKAKKVVVEHPSNGSFKTPFAGHMDSKKEENEKREYSDINNNNYKSNESILTMFENQFDRNLLCSGKVWNGLTPAQRQQKLEQHASQPTNTSKLSDNCPSTQVMNQNGTERLINRGDEPQKNINKQSIEELSNLNWLLIQMPSEFEYTGAGLLNHTLQGFLHILLRHWDQWSQHIPDLLDGLGELRAVLDDVRNATDRQTLGAAYNAFNVALNRLNQQRFYEIRSELLRAQLAIYRFLIKNLRFDNYIEEGINDRGQVQVYFRVRNEIMVVCVSRELYPAVSEFGDARPVRIISTVFFITEEQFKNLSIRAGRAWPKKK